MFTSIDIDHIKQELEKQEAALLQSFFTLMDQSEHCDQLIRLYGKNGDAYKEMICMRHAGYVSQLSRYFKSNVATRTASEKSISKSHPHANTPPWITDQLQLARVAYLIQLTQIIGTNALCRCLEQWETFADEGENRAINATLPFIWRLSSLSDQLEPNALDIMVNLSRRACRSNSVNVFSATALHNPFAAVAFDELAWNQLVIKAIFLERSVYHIAGFSERLNSELARMAMDLIEERDAAKRMIPLDLWLCLADFENTRLIARAQRSILENAYQEVCTHDALFSALALYRADLPLDSKAHALLRASQFRLEIANSEPDTRLALPYVSGSATLYGILS